MGTREREREKGGSKEAVLSEVKSKVVVVVCVCLCLFEKETL